MAKDNLEKFIIKERAAFDDKNPSEKVWHNVNRRLSSSGKSLVWWKVAAIFFFATSIGLTYQNYLKSSISPHELSELETFYFEQIDYKQSLLNEYQLQGNSSGDGFDQDLQKLDAMYKVLKEEWQRKPSREVLEALTLNLIVRIDLLNRQLEMIEEEPEKNKTKGVNI